MPGGIENPVVGALVFTGIKFAGYTLAAVHLNRKLGSASKPAAVGGLRTVIGIVFGVLVWGFTLWVPSPIGKDAAYIVLLAPVRLFEWWLLLRVAYAKAPFPGWMTLIRLVLWSYALDIPAVFGLVITGGFWVC